MRHPSGIAALLVVLVAGGRGVAGEPSCRCEPPGNCFLERLGPVGGWSPYGGGLLHWWNPHCFPQGGTPDDYCRKKLPRTCWPHYPDFYLWGLPPISPRQGDGSPPCDRPQ